MKIFKALLIGSMSIALLNGCTDQNEPQVPTTLKAPACTGQSSVLDQISHQK